MQHLMIFQLPVLMIFGSRSPQKCFDCTAARSSLSRGASTQGLGKTIVTLALVKANPAPLFSAHSAPTWGRLSVGCHALSGRIKSRATLVVCPVSLVSQWSDEACARLSEMHKKSVYRYYGSGRIRDVQRLAQNYDIVVTTFAVLASDWRGKRKKESKKEDAEFLPDPTWQPGPLQQIHWWRVVLDGERSGMVRFSLTGPKFPPHSCLFVVHMRIL